MHSNSQDKPSPPTPPPEASLHSKLSIVQRLVNQNLLYTVLRIYIPSLKGNFQMTLGIKITSVSMNDFLPIPDSEFNTNGLR